MKKTLIFTVVMALLFVSVIPAFAGNGNGGGGGRGNGHGRNGNAGSQQRQGTGGNGGRKQGSNVLTGIISDIDGTAEVGSITLMVYGGKDISLYGTEVEVRTDVSTRFLLKDYGAITFDELEVGDAASIAIGSDGIADRITVGVVCPCIP